MHILLFTYSTKTGEDHLFATIGRKYQFLADHLQEYPIRVMCRALEVSESGYYAWKEREQPSAHEREDARIAAEIQQIFQEHRQVYGSPVLTTWDIRSKTSTFLIIKVLKRLGKFFVRE